MSFGENEFVAKLESLIDSYAKPLAQVVLERYQRSQEFRETLIRYVEEEHDWPWPSAITFAELENRITNLTKLSLLLLCLKIVFYYALFTLFREAGLLELKVDNFHAPDELSDYLWQKYFKLASDKVGYGEVFGKQPTFIDNLPFISEDIIQFLNHLIENINEFDFSKVPYDIVGKIFEKLIEKESRYQMGQYFTRADIASLITVFAVKRGSEFIMDAGAGSGIFSIQAYERMKAKLPNQDHGERLQRIWSCEISPFLARLTMFNMILRDLRSKNNHPIIINDDFFKLNGFYQVKIKKLDGSEEYTNLPQFDAVVSNPPYTRQEMIRKVSDDLKARASMVCSVEWPSIKIPKTSSLFAYFMLHGGALLREGGRLGMITSNSWLDVDYGRAIQEMLLKNFKLIAIIDSKVERWFEAADVNTCITIAERCSDEAKRQSNPVRFVYLLVRLDELWKHYTVEKFANEIETLKEPGVHQNRFYKAFVIRQSELLAEATNSEGNFTGAKWGKYLRAPAVYFRILERAKDRLVPLGSVAKVRSGIKTGVNDFFYLRDITDEIPEAERPKHTGLSEEERKKKKIRICINALGKEVLIEEEFLKPVIKNTRDAPCVRIIAHKLPWQILLVNKSKNALRGKEVLRYIDWAERNMGYQNRPSCVSRKPWYSLGQRKPAEINLSYQIYDYARVFIGRVFASDNFQEIHTKSKEIACFLVSTPFILFQNVLSRSNFGGGLLRIQTYEWEQMMVLDPKYINEKIKNRFEILAERPYEKLFMELTKPDRRELDLAVLEALGFEDEQEQKEILEEIYKEVLDMVKARFEKAKAYKGDKGNLQNSSLEKGG